MTITIHGTLDRAPEYRRSLDGDALLILSIACGVGFPWEVRLSGGTEPGNHITQQFRAQQIKRGADVQVTGGGAEPCTDHGHARLTLRRVRSCVVAGQVLL